MKTFIVNNFSEPVSAVNFLLFVKTNKGENTTLILAETFADFLSSELCPDFEGLPSLIHLKEDKSFKYGQLRFVIGNTIGLNVVFIPNKFDSLEWSLGF